MGALKPTMRALGSGGTPLAGLRGLSDAPLDPLYQFTANPTGSGGAGAVRELVQAPITEGNVSFPNDLAALMEVIRLLNAMPGALQTTLRTRFMIVPREALPILGTSAEVSVPTGGAQTALVSVTVPDGYVGYITKLGLAVVAPGNMSDITFYVKVSGIALPPPASSGLKIAQNTLLAPDDFPFEITSGKTVTVYASNANVSDAVICAAKLVGWVERTTEYKPYGTSPQSGV